VDMAIYNTKRTRYIRTVRLSELDIPLDEAASAAPSSSTSPESLDSRAPPVALSRVALSAAGLIVGYGLQVP